MKLEELLNQLNALVDKDTSILKDNVILSIEHDKATDCEVIKLGYSDESSPTWLLEYEDVDDWIIEMGYDDLADAIEDSNLRRTVMLL